MKRVLLVALLVGLLLTGCGFLRNLDTPKDRLIGHWITGEGANLYFGPLINDQGTLIVVPAKGIRQNYIYKVTGQNEETDEVTVEVSAEDQPTVTRIYRIPSDGIYMREQTEPVPDEEKTEYVFGDTAIQPSPYVETLAAEEATKNP